MRSRLRALLPGSPLELGGLAVLAVFTLLAVVGFGVIALHPERLPADGLSRAVYRNSYPLFAQLHILLSAVALGIVLVRRTGGRWVAGAVVVCVLSFLAEHVGTGYGLPFGEYGYSGLLGYKIGGRVPALIPLSWFLVSLPAYVLATRAFPGGAGAGAASRILLATALLVAWDLALDPAMSFLTPYWWWGESGAYYGMPAINLLGWALTGLVLMVALEALGTRALADRLPARWLGAYYGVVVALPLGMVAAAGLWGAVAATLAAVGALALLVHRRAALHAVAAAAAPRPGSPGDRAAGRIPVGG